MAHLPKETLQQRLAEASMKVEIGAKYVHYKDDSKAYVVKELVIIEANDEVGVIYEWDYEPRISFLRPLEDFLATVVEKDGESVPRFRKL